MTHTPEGNLMPQFLKSLILRTLNCTFILCLLMITAQKMKFSIKDFFSKNTKLLNKYKTLVFRAVFQFIKIEYD